MKTSNAGPDVDEMEALFKAAEQKLSEQAQIHAALRKMVEDALRGKGAKEDSGQAQGMGRSGGTE